MGCDCHLEPTDNGPQRVLVLLLTINAVMFIIEVVAGLLGDSSGVLADSLDMLTDALVYGIALFAIGRAVGVRRRAAWWAGVFQLLLATGIVVDVVRRAIWGSEPESGLMLAMAALALLANSYCLSRLHQHRQGEVHLRASWIFTRTDVIANCGVLAAGLLVWTTASRWPDLIVGAAIALIVLHGAYEILRDVHREARAAAA